MMRGSLNKERLKSSGDNTNQTRKRKAREVDGSAETTQNKEPEQEGGANSRDMIMPGFVRATNNFANGSSQREKLKPIRSHYKAAQREVKLSDKEAESNMNMDNMSLKDMLRFLDEEEVLLTQLQSKVSEELSRLQVEEHVFLHTLKIFGEKHDGLCSKLDENHRQSWNEDQELIDALNKALKESGESKIDNVDKGKACT